MAMWFVVAMPDVEKKTLRTALGIHANSLRYLKAMETATERFVREVAARLGRPELAGDAHFEQVVLNHFVAGSFDGALAAWSAAEARNR